MDSKKLEEANKRFEKQKKAQSKSGKRGAEQAKPDGMNRENFKKNLGCGG